MTTTAKIEELQKSVINAINSSCLITRNIIIFFTIDFVSNTNLDFI